MRKSRKSRNGNLISDQDHCLPTLDHAREIDSQPTPIPSRASRVSSHLPARFASVTNYALSFPLMPKRTLIFLSQKKCVRSRLTFCRLDNVLRLEISNSTFNLGYVIDYLGIKLASSFRIPGDRNFSHDFNDSLSLEGITIGRRDKIIKPARRSALQRLIQNFTSAYS